MTFLNLALALSLLLCSLPAFAEFKNWIFPETTWQVESPENLGLDSTKLKAAFSGLKAKMNADETVVIRRGYLVYRGSKSKNRHGVWSCAKSFTSSAAGALVDQGVITLNDPASKYMTSLKSKYSKVTLRNFATMTSGYDASGGSYGPGGEDGSSTPFSVASPSFAPGSHFAYWDDAMNMYGATLSKAAGRNFASVFKDKVAKKIGLTRYQWNPVFDAGGMKVSSGSGNKQALEIDAEEMARFCYLFLNQGEWKGEAVLSKQWVSDATRVQVPATLPVHKKTQNWVGVGQYGYNWWINAKDKDGELLWPSAPEGTYGALGAKGNFCIVIPKWEMVVVRLGTSGSGGPQNELLKKIGESIKK